MNLYADFCEDISYKTCWEISRSVFGSVYGKTIMSFIRKWQLVFQEPVLVYIDTSSECEFLLLHMIVSHWSCRTFFILF